METKPELTDAEFIRELARVALITQSYQDAFDLIGEEYHTAYRRMKKLGYNMEREPTRQRLVPIKPLEVGLDNG